MKKKILILFALVALATSCKSQFELLLQSNDVDAKYKAAFEFYNKGKYSKAASLFESLSALTTATERDDTVGYYWGLSNYKFKDFYTAETNFERFIENFPRSPFVSEAKFLRLDCLYRSTLRYELDQTPTHKAIQAITEYIKENPDTQNMKVCQGMLKELNERLDTKAYEAAKLYYKMEDYLASRVAFRNVIKDNSENIYRENILYYIAMSSYKYAHLSIPSKQKERYMTFVDDYYNFIGEYEKSVYRKELDNVFMRAQKQLNNRRLTKEQESATERDFAKERKKFEREAKKLEREQKAQEKAEQKSKKSKKTKK